MMQVTTDGLDQLAADWPNWHMWRSRRGELVCATRRSGPGYTLVANSERDLLAQLQAEAKREAAML